jgi:thiol-disulfide isomerase/thioredoxin
MRYLRFKNVCWVLLLFVFGSGCITMDGKYSSIAPGSWRGVLHLKENTVTLNKKGEPLPEKLNFKFDEATNGELPFLFEVIYINDSAMRITFINGEERITVESKDIKVGHNRSTGRDTFRIDFPLYASYLRGLYQERVMEGEFVNDKGISIPFSARQGDNHRFTTLNKQPTADISGEWETTIGIFDSIPEKAIAEFQQKGNVLRGTFRTETGDYRYLDGEVQANKLYLSCFDGTHTYLFEGKIEKDEIIGIFRASKTYEKLWAAKRNPNFKLRSADSLTYLKAGAQQFDFNFATVEGKKIGLNAPEYIEKVRVLQIMGTWCPNCSDETKFLVEYLQKHNHKDLAIIGLAFERNATLAAQQLPIYKSRLNVPYEIALAGTSNKRDEAAKALPMLNAIIGYPTMIVVDKKGKVRKIHTGFDGPATSKYATFKQEFNDLIEKLLNE